MLQRISIRESSLMIRRLVRPMPPQCGIDMSTVLSIDSSATKRGFLKAIRNIGPSYIRFSNRSPYVCSSLTGLTVLGLADVTSQFLTQRAQFHSDYSKSDYRPKFTFNWDRRRTVALSTFGLTYYGFICKKLYFCYDSFFTQMSKQLRSQSLVNLMPAKSIFFRRPITIPLAKTLFDCAVHTPFVLLPCFYFITGTIKGQNPSEITSQLRKEWFTSATATFVYWFPLMLTAFAYFSMASRILFITSASFLHKSALSWYSNRNRHAQPAQQLAVSDYAQNEAVSAMNIGKKEEKQIEPSQPLFEFTIGISNDNESHNGASIATLAADLTRNGKVMHSS